MLKHGYSSSEDSDEYEHPVYHPPAEPIIHRDYYETDYHDLKASLSSFFALPPRFEFTGKNTVQKERKPPKDLLRTNKRSTSETKLVGLRDVREMKAREARRSSCCCSACGGLQLSLKFIMSQIPRSDILIKPKVSKLESFVNSLPISSPKRPAKSSHTKNKPPPSQRVLVVPPPYTPRIFTLFEQSKQDELKAQARRQQQLTRKPLVWERVVPPKLVLPELKTARLTFKLKSEYSRSSLLEPVLKSSRVMSSGRSTLSTAQTQRPLTKRQELRRLYS